MQTVEELSARISTAESLESVVSTMKALAAVSIQQLEGVVRSIDTYNRTVELALEGVLRRRPQGARMVEAPITRDLGAIVLGSDQGMCGQFNEEIASYAIEDIERLAEAGGEATVLGVGVRTASQLDDTDYELEEYLSIPASPVGIAPVVDQIAMQIQRWQAQRAIERVKIYYQRRISSGRFEPAGHLILPIDSAWLERIQSRSWPTNVLPIATMDWRPLFGELLHQHILVTLYRAIVHSMMSEQTARMISMQAAEQNIEERLEELRATFRTTRQTAITSELLDIVSGFETLRSPDDV